VAFLVLGAVVPKSMEESFVVLSSASMLRQLPHPGGVTRNQSSQPQQSEGAAVGLDAKLQALSHLFDMASLQTQVDHPLCLDCEVQLKDEIEAQVTNCNKQASRIKLRHRCCYAFYCNLQMLSPLLLLLIHILMRQSEQL
jgi:hypothetical protein